MGGWDSYCFLTGARFMWHEGEIRDAAIGFGITNLSSTCKKGLRYSMEDVEWSKKYVIICPYEIMEDGTRKILARMCDPTPYIFGPENITTVFNIAPTGEAEIGDYRNTAPDEGDDGMYNISTLSPAMLVTHGAYLIFLQAAAALQPHALLRMCLKSRGYGTLGGLDIDYGPINCVTGEQYIFWPGIACSGWDSSRSQRMVDAKLAWQRITEGKSDGEVLEDAWRGRGNLWAMVRPDRFPISETSLDSLTDYKPASAASLDIQDSRLRDLPLELLTLVCQHLHPPSLHQLMSTCKTVYSRILPHINAIVHTHVERYEPWYLPAGPFNIPNGSDEIEWWNAQWADKLGSTGTSVKLNDRIPWLQYRRACSHSMSMWNRIRIWRVIKSLEAKAEAAGFI